VETALLRRDSRGADEMLAALNTEDARRADALRVLSRAVRALEHSAQDATAAAATPSSRIALERHPGFASALTRCVAAAEAIAAREDDDGALDWSARASVAAAMHGIAKLHRARRVDALSRGRSGSGSGSTSATTSATVADTWRALVRATPKLSDGFNAKQATDVAWALAVVASDASASTTRTRAQTATDRVELAEAWRAIEDATARAPATRAKHASVATWAAAKMQSGAFYTLVPIRPRRRGERHSLRTFAVVSLRPPLAFNPRPRRLSTPSDAYELHPDIALYGTTLSARRAAVAAIFRRARETRRRVRIHTGPHTTAFVVRSRGDRRPLLED
jgi:hypothetical protein